MDESLDAGGAGGVEQDLGTNDVGADERPGVHDAAINMALGGKVDDGMDAGHGGGDGCGIGDVAFDETIARMPSQIGKVDRVASVGESVEIDDAEVRVFFQDIANKIATDEATTAGNEQGRHGRI